MGELINKLINNTVKPIFMSLKIINQMKEKLKSKSDNYTSWYCLLVLKQFSFYRPVVLKILQNCLWADPMLYFVDLRN